MSTSQSNSTSSPSSDDNGFGGGRVAVSITSIVVGGVVAIVIAVLITKVIKKRKKQRNNSLVQNNGGVIPTTTLQNSTYGDVIPTTTVVQNSTNGAANPTTTVVLNSSVSWDSEIEVTSIERFIYEFQKERPVRFTPQHLMNFTANYAERLGSGGFGVVYKGQFPNGVLVAVKVLNGTLDKRAEGQFMAEVGTIGRTYHVNLVRLYGFCFHAALKALVYEYMENGSLDNHLFDDKNKSRIEWDKLHEIAIGTAKGIRYLHEECDVKIVHYDIKPGNVLLGKNFSPKVADFGLAKLCDRKNTHLTITGVRGTPGYAAPELWMPFPVTQKCDVYSFGMLLFEILGRRRNLEFATEDVESQEWFPRWVWQKFEQGEMEKIISICGIQEKDILMAEKMCGVALWCVQYQAEARPSMNTVVKMLEGEQEIVAPTNPFQYMSPVIAASGVWSQSTSESTSTSTRKNESELSILLQR